MSTTSIWSALPSTLFLSARPPRRSRVPRTSAWTRATTAAVERQVRKRGIVPHIRRRGEKPLIGCVRGRPRRWVVERTNGWHNRFRALLIRWETIPEHYEAMVHFACALITLRAAHRRNGHRF